MGSIFQTDVFCLSRSSRPSEIVLIWLYLGRYPRSEMNLNMGHYFQKKQSAKQELEALGPIDHPRTLRQWQFFLWFTFLDFKETSLPCWYFLCVCQLTRDHIKQFFMSWIPRHIQAQHSYSSAMRITSNTIIWLIHSMDNRVVTQPTLILQTV